MTAAAHSGLLFGRTVMVIGGPLSYNPRHGDGGKAEGAKLGVGFDRRSVSMAITFGCVCGKSLKAKDDLAGKKTKCPACGSILSIPALERTPADDDEAAGYLLEPENNPPRPAALKRPPLAPALDEPVFLSAPRKQEKEPTPKAAKRDREKKPEAASIREYSYWLLLFALVPLVFSLLSAEEQTFAERLETTMENAAPEQAKQIEAVLAKAENITRDELFAVLPEGKLFGAHLSQSTVIHWVYAAVATTGFLLLILLMFSVERSNPAHLLGIGLFTGTVGIVFLLAVQFCAQIDIRSIRACGWFGLILLILALIGLSYRSALDEDSNFLLSAVGFTFGVGLCEELTKAIPLLFYYQRFATMGWRGACLWGLASGIGFGVSEGIMYSASSYNGISGPGIYVVRFVSCVAIHAMWAGAVGITIARTVDAYEAVEDRLGFGLYVLRVLAVPMVLHGLYDTLLKKDMNVWALVIALASFAWLAFQIESARGAMPESGRDGRRSLAAN
jgi:RsiW-degrading membrane proteinase PrsW (M82 family)